MTEHLNDNDMPSWRLKLGLRPGAEGEKMHRLWTWVLPVSQNPGLRRAVALSSFRERPDQC